MVAGAFISFPAIQIEGEEYPGLGYNVLSLSVTETIEGLFNSEVSFHNHGDRPNGEIDYLFFERDVLDFGKKIDILLGNPPNPIFTGRITALEANFSVDDSPTMTVLAEDDLQALRMKRRSRLFEDFADADIIAQIAGEHGLTTDMDISSVVHRSVAQVNLSDLAFIRQRARANGAELWLDDGTLYVRSRPDRNQDAPFNLDYGANLLSFSVMADLAHQVSEVVVSGWDVSAKEMIAEHGDSTAISAELNGLESGTSILEQHFDTRVETVVHTTPLTVDEARDYAKALYQERARKFVCGSGMARGHSELRVGRKVNVRDVGIFSGEYIVTQAIHTYDNEHGYRTEFNIERVGM